MSVYKNWDKIHAIQEAEERLALEKAGKILGGIKAVVLNHPQGDEAKYSITEYGELTKYQGYRTAEEFLKALEEKCK